MPSQQIKHDIDIDGCVNSSFGSFFVERGVAQAVLKRLYDGMHLQFIGDSSILVDCLLGRACAKDAEMLRAGC